MSKIGRWFEKFTSVPHRQPGRTHLIIGDAHAHPDHDLDRFVWLGRMVADIQPDIVVSIGDWADMPSLCTYDRGRKGFEGRRYIKDIEAANEALNLYHRELGPYKCDHVWTVGNHENRIDRATEADAVLDGLITLDDLDFRRRGWEVVPFGIPISIDGVAYGHYHTKGPMARPISGQNHARNMLNKLHYSTVAGHSHFIDMAFDTNVMGERLQSLVVGSYFGHREGYAGRNNWEWWRGIVVLRDVIDGRFDIETWEYDRIRRTWG